MVESFMNVQPIELEEKVTQSKSRSYDLWYNGKKKEILTHVHRCFSKYGGELRKEGRCFLTNENFVIYVLYRALSKDESKVVKMTGSCVKQLEAIACDTGKIPLIAVLVKPDGALPFYGLLPLHSIETVLVEAGSRNAGYPFFRRKNGESLKEKINEEDAVFIHVRHEEDKRALLEACGSSDERPEWASAFYGGGFGWYSLHGKLEADYQRVLEGCTLTDSLEKVTSRLYQFVLPDKRDAFRNAAQHAFGVCL